MLQPLGSGTVTATPSPARPCPLPPAHRATSTAPSPCPPLHSPSQERQRRAVEAEKLQEAESGVERMQSLVNKYTKDFLALKHDALQAQREEKETIEALRIDNRQARAAMDKGREAATLELQQHSSSAKASSEQYVALFRQQVRANPSPDPDHNPDHNPAPNHPDPNPNPNLNPDPDPDPDPDQVTDTERTMGLLKDRHSGLQQALTMRVRELEEGSSRFKHKYRQLEERRRLEVEGFRSELDLLHRQLQGVEMRVFGKRTPLMELTDLESSQQGGGGAPSSFDGKTAVTRKALRAVSSRIAELAQAAP